MPAAVSTGVHAAMHTGDADDDVVRADQLPVPVRLRAMRPTTVLPPLQVFAPLTLPISTLILAARVPSTSFHLEVPVRS